MEAGGGDLGEGEGEGRVGAICFYFPLSLAFFGFSPQLPYKGKNAPIEKRDQRGGAGVVGEECGGGWRRFGGGRVRGRVGAICFLFSPATCLFWVFPTTSL